MNTPTKWILGCAGVAGIVLLVIVALIVGWFIWMGVIISKSPTSVPSIPNPNNTPPNAPSK